MQIRFWDLRMPCMPTSIAQPPSGQDQSGSTRKGRGRQVQNAVHIAACAIHSQPSYPHLSLLEVELK